MDSVYLDHNATTPLDPRVLAAMMPALEGSGNASSLHAFGRRAREAVETARDQVAALLGASPREIVFAGSGTEANNAVLGTLRELDGGGHVVVSAFEHPSILAAADRLEEQGFAVSRVRPERTGRLRATAIGEELRDDTRLVCLMLANNEVGSLQPVAEVAELARARGVPVLCDAVQAVGKIPFTAPDLGVDYLTIGAHKFYGPLGAAALWIRRGASFFPLLVGGSQERHRRASTLNVPAIVGLGAASALAAAELGEWARRMRGLRDAFETGLSTIGGAEVHAADVPRLPNTTNVAFPGVDAEALMVRLDLEGFAVSTGSACSSGVVEMSDTMRALGIEEAVAVASVRVSFGKDSPDLAVERLLEVLRREVAALRELSLPGARR